MSEEEIVNLPPDECYRQMGFQPFTGGPHVIASEWRHVLASSKLKDMHQRYAWLRDLAGAPIVDLGFVIGWVPPLRLGPTEFERLMDSLEKGLAAGCATVADWQKRKLSLN